MDFSSSINLPICSSTASSYDNIINAIGGLLVFAASFWYSYLCTALHRCRSFTISAKLQCGGLLDASRVNLTLDFVNQFIGDVFKNVIREDQSWWSDLNQAIEDISIKNAEWLIAYVSCTSISSSTYKSRVSEKSEMSSTVPSNIRSLIPKSVNGDDLCLKFASQVDCNNTRNGECLIKGRSHKYRGKLPRELLEWIKERYGGVKKQFE